MTILECIEAIDKLNLVIKEIPFSSPLFKATNNTYLKLLKKIEDFEITK